MIKFKKIFVVAIASVLFGFCATAQVYVGGQVGGSYSQENPEDYAWSYSFAPEVWYRFGEKLSLGAKVSYGKTYAYSNIISQNPGGSYTINKETDINIAALTITPYAEYRLWDISGFELWLEGSLGFVPKMGVSVGMAPVLTYQLDRHLLFKATLGCAGIMAFHSIGAYSKAWSVSGFAGSDNALNSIGFAWRF